MSTCCIEEQKILSDMLPGLTCCQAISKGLLHFSLLSLCLTVKQPHWLQNGFVSDQTRYPPHLAHTGPAW